MSSASVNIILHRTLANSDRTLPLQRRDKRELETLCRYLSHIRSSVNHCPMSCSEEPCNSGCWGGERSRDIGLEAGSLGFQTRIWWEMDPSSPHILLLPEKQSFANQDPCIRELTQASGNLGIWLTCKDLEGRARSLICSRQI